MDDDLIRATRSYLSDYLGDEEGWQENIPAGLPEWFIDLADHVASLPLHDPRLVEAARCMKPFFEDGQDLDGYLMYPEGEAVDYIERSWGGDPEEFFSGFVTALATDYESWAAGAFRRPTGDRDPRV